MTVVRVIAAVDADRGGGDRDVPASWPGRARWTVWSRLDTLVAGDDVRDRHLGGAFSLDTTGDVQPDGARADQLRRLGERRPVPGARHPPQPRHAEVCDERRIADILAAVLVLSGSALALDRGDRRRPVPRHPHTHARARPSRRCWACCWCWWVPRSGSVAMRTSACVILTAYSPSSPRRLMANRDGAVGTTARAEPSRRPAHQGRNTRVRRRTERQWPELTTTAGTSPRASALTALGIAAPGGGIRVGNGNARCSPTLTRGCSSMRGDGTRAGPAASTTRLSLSFRRPIRS